MDLAHAMFSQREARAWLQPSPYLQHSPAYETFLGTLIMVVFLLARMFLKFNVHPSGVLGPSYRRFGSTCTMSIWTRDMEGDAKQPPFTTLTRQLHKALALALAPLPRPLEWSGTQSPLAPQILSPAGLKNLFASPPSRRLDRVDHRRPLIVSESAVWSGAACVLHAVDANFC